MSPAPSVASSVVPELLDGNSCVRHRAPKTAAMEPSAACTVVVWMGDSYAKVAGAGGLVVACYKAGWHGVNGGFALEEVA